MNLYLQAKTGRKTAGNPIVTSIYTADPSAHAWGDGRLYIYASHDMDPARGCDRMDRYHVFSSANLVDWTDEGEILRSDDVAWGRPEGGFMWAPDAAFKNGVYYFYYPHPSGTDWNGTWKIGVATSAEPARGFQDQGFMDGLGGFAMIDPCVFEDEDGKHYFYYGGGGRCQGGELGEDMMSIRGGMTDMEGLVDFHEAAWVFKRGGLYYLTYADNLEDNNRMRYATSASPLGPWTYRGIFLEPTGCSTTHGSVAEFKGEWYLFYHNQAVSDQGNLRSMCIDRLEFEADGSIRTVEQTAEGVARVGDTAEPERPRRLYPAADARLEGGARLESESFGAAGGLEATGAAAVFDGVDGGRGGRAAVRVIYASSERLAKLRLIVNGEDWSLLNALSTGGAERFEGETGLTVPLRPGASNEIRLEGGCGDMRIAGLAVELLDA
ncbi:family 43 glycosylhydrolase [Paenibacillus sp. B01]|uniref:family 43 glycosylhydrolase n=1 Tax=Paenibacillus sp. B01 TaxID=2660554 RepID=UPI00129B991D|nr:family 43 glycosylhydrolase [Paenibacillus sp. B01]QGG55676.1 family 43 glycosylhydrolase [Paenibacillus sp. B01]